MRSTSLSGPASGEEDYKLAKTVGTHYMLLKALYPYQEFNLHELSNETGKDLGNLSKQIKRLERQGIVETREVKSERGRPFKYISLSTKVVRIVSHIIEAVKPARTQYSASVIDSCLNVMEDDGLDEEIRSDYAYLLYSKFSDIPVKMLGEHERLRRTLEEVMKNPSANGEVEKWKRSMIKASLPKLMMDESSSEWVHNHVYINALGFLQDVTKPESIVAWAISLLENIAARSPNEGTVEEIKTRLMNTYFDEANRLDSEVAKALQSSILQLFCQQATLAKKLIDYLREQAKNSKSDTKSAKAIVLLKEIARYLPGL